MRRNYFLNLGFGILPKNKKSREEIEKNYLNRLKRILNSNTGFNPNLSQEELTKCISYEEKRKTYAREFLAKYEQGDHFMDENGIIFPDVKFIEYYPSY